jgi:hypothetical protein
MTGRRILIGRALLVLGIMGGFTSVWYTVAFTWDPLFGATNLPDGPTHSNYHAFRGAMLAFAVNMLLIWVGIKGASVKSETWGIATFMAVLYYLGWWIAWPIWGYHAPSFIAELNHVFGTVGGLGALYFLRPREEV